MDNTNEKIRIKYYECNMTRKQHIIAYICCVLAVFALFYIYYRSVVISLPAALALGIYLEKEYSKSVIKKRQKKLRVQFKEFLDIITISISGGSGRSMENAIKDSIKELKLLYSDNSDIVREIGLIISDFDRAGVPMKDGFKEFGQRTDIDDIISFATIYSTIDGKTSDFGYIITQTRDIIKDKVEITAEIETSINTSKMEAYMMLVLPLLIIISMSVMGSGFLDSLFTTFSGRIAATIGLVFTIISFLIAVKVTDIDV